MAETNNPQQRIRIRLRAYDHRVLDASVGKIVETAQRTGAVVSGPILLPTHIKKYTVLRPPHRHTQSRRQFEMQASRQRSHPVRPVPQPKQECPQGNSNPCFRLERPTS